MIDEQKVKIHDVQFVEIKHEGPCSKNTNLVPSIAEEFSWEDAACLLIFDSDGNFRGEDKAIFCDPVVCDGDT